jgi:undecaprenyl-diphosphatase
VLAVPANFFALPFWFLEPLERPIVHWIACRLHSPVTDWLFLNAQSKSVAVPALGLLIAAMAARRPRLALRTLASCLGAWLLAMLVASVLWAVVARPRPQAVYGEVLRTPEALAACAARPDALPLRTGGSTSPSFPSRHGCSIGVFVATVWLASRPLGIAAALWGLVAAVGRVYAGKHWPSDVLAGILIGVAIAAWTWPRLPRLLDRWARRGPGGDAAPG